MSTFGLLGTAASGLAAARAGMDVVGQNIANLNTAGYTRQRVLTSPTPALSGANVLDTHFRVGQGVSIDGVQRLGDALLEGRARGAVALAGETAGRATTLQRLEATLREPGELGLSNALSGFWNTWQDVSLRPTDPAVRGVMIETATDLATRIAHGAQSTRDLWSATRAEASAIVDDVNAAAASLAELNGRIRQLGAAGGTVSELIDQRANAASALAELTGGTVRDRGDGMVDVLVGGTALVLGDSARQLALTGASSLDGAGADPVRVAWTHREGAAEISGGRLGAALGVLSPAAAGSGGAIAEQAAAYDRVATELADRVNAIHRTGSTPDGTTGVDFFTLTPGTSAALGLRVGVDAAGIAAADPATGAGGGGIADAISQLRDVAGGPSGVWAEHVVLIGSRTRSAVSQATIAEQAMSVAERALLSQTSVDLDEETMSLMTYQHAYQGAARVLTAVDEMLDTLINRTGLVGR
ncbi:MAG: flagellar hook-associated protein FlgK [Microbacteriaceae bacterium]